MNVQPSYPNVGKSLQYPSNAISRLPVKANKMYVK